MPTKLRFLEQIFSKLSERSSPLSQAEIEELIKSLTEAREELASHELFDDAFYRRNRLFSSEQIDILLLCWRPSQRTPIHDHLGSVCGFHVLRGEATEVAFTRSGLGPLVPSETKVIRAGETAISVDTDAHLVGNFAANNTDLVTLHCYSPPLSSMRVFDQNETFFAHYEHLTDYAAQSSSFWVKP
ncbi:MAG: cysteine dioxygenase [Pseudomonadota bacterium]|jgi:cysteine dioxygenase